MKIASFLIPTKFNSFRDKRVYEAIIKQQSIESTHNAKLAIIVHLYYKDLWPIIAEKLKYINVTYDLYLSVKEEDKNFNIKKINAYHGKTNIIYFPNQGRDVLPFLQTVQILKNHGAYSYALKLHTKKSPHRKDGSEWLESLLQELIPKDTTSIIKTLEKNNTGIIGPKSHVVSLTRYLGLNRKNIVKYLSKIHNNKLVKDTVNKASLYPFFGGTMFWTRLDFIEPLSKSLSIARFEKESGQVDGTTAHAVERIIGGLLHHLMGRTMYTVNVSGKVETLDSKLYEDKYRYAPD